MERDEEGSKRREKSFLRALVLGELSSFLKGIKGDKKIHANVQDTSAGAVGRGPLARIRRRIPCSGEEWHWPQSSSLEAEGA